MARLEFLGNASSVDASGSRRRRLVARIAVAGLIAASACPFALAASPQEPPSSLERYRCTICHAPYETLAGPAFADVAAKYAGDRDAIAKIAYMIRRGVRSGAPWHMPPHPEVSAADARTMARYIMSLSAVPPGRTVAGPR